MKKFLYTILLSLFLSFGFAQSSYNFVFPKSGSYDWQNSVGVELSEAYCGKEGILTGVNRSSLPNKYGNYEYQIWMATNSFSHPNNGCQRVFTYAENIFVYYWNGATKLWYLPNNFTPIWGNVGDAMIVYYLYSPNPNLYIKVSVGKYQISSY